MKTSFGTRVSQMGLGSFVDINICYKILFYVVSSYSYFFRIFATKSTQMLKPQKGNSGVSFN